MDKNNWNKLKESFSDFSVPAPEGLWEGIEQGLSPVPKKASLVPLRWVALAVSAAAAVALVVFLPRQKEQGVDPTTAIAVVTPADASDQPLVPETVPVEILPDDAVGENPAPAPRTGFYRPSSLPSSGVDIVPSEEILPADDIPQADPVVPETGDTPVETVTEGVETTVKETVQETVQETSGDETPSGTFDEWEPDRPAFRRSHSVLIGASTSSISQSGNYQNTGYGMPMGTAASAMAADPNSLNRLVRMMVTNQPTYREALHRMPVRVGINLAFPLTDQWWVESGLVLTQLSSTFQTTAGASFASETRQSLLYLGVPLTVSYRIPFRRSFCAYAGAGVMGEYAIRAVAATTTSLAGSQKEYDKKSFDAGGLLWSANAHLGLEAGITDHLGLYLEPGVGYHFDNGSDVESAYTYHPLDFHLTFGLRLRLK